MRFRMLVAVTPLLLPLALSTVARAQPPAPPDSAASTPPAPVRARVAPQARTGWMFGSGGGFAIGRPKEGAHKPDFEASGSFHLRFGAGVGGNALVGVEYLAWTAHPTDSTSYEVLAIGPSLTCFTRSNFFVRGMVGWASVKGHLFVGDPSTEVPIADDGFAYLLAAGWEWRYRRRLAIAPQVEYLVATAGNGTFADVASGSLQLNWYY